jgi:hypothetical protein
MKRRTFVAGFLTALCSLFGNNGNAKNEADDHVLANRYAAIAENLCRLVRDPRNAMWIGQRYLAESRAVLNEDTLRADRSMRFFRARSSASSSALTEAFRAQRVSDFAKGDVILVDNWILSRCEVHVFALLALLQGEPVGA